MPMCMYARTEHRAQLDLIFGIFLKYRANLNFTNYLKTESVLNLFVNKVLETAAISDAS